MNADLASELEALEVKEDTDIDFDDLPEQLDWSNAEIGKFYRPRKSLVSLRVDQDVLAWFKRLAKDNEQGYLTLMNQALRAYVCTQEETQGQREK